MLENLNRLLGLPRSQKRLLVLFLDVLMALLALWLSFVLRLEEFVSLAGRPRLAVLLAIALVVLTFNRLGVYSLVFRYGGRAAATILVKGWLVYGALFCSVVTVITLPDVPRSIGIMQPLLFLILASGSRYIIRGYISLRNEDMELRGVKTVSLVGSVKDLERLATLTVDDPSLEITGIFAVDFEADSRIFGHKVKPLSELASEDKVSNRHVICIPDSSWGRPVFDELLAMFDALPNAIIRRIPDRKSNYDITKSLANDLDLNELFGRKQVEVKSCLIENYLKEKVVLVSGAGGTIGSELVRQCLLKGAAQVIGLDQSEHSLYLLTESELGEDPRLLVRLCDCKNIRDIMIACHGLSIDIILHAAAYKHVSMVEDNPLIGLRNNLISTINLLDFASSSSASSFVLVSSDKAVRPSNLMGASKRLAEIVCSEFVNNRARIRASFGLESETLGPTPAVSVVRFGNVIGSSGSVLLKFREQVLSGKRVTVTDPRVIRYFMTADEAVSLVLASGALSTSGFNLYHLDMGDPIKIVDLARRMIFALGGHANTDSTIEFTGLKPGEKLCEELLISGKSIPTAVERILKVRNEPDEAGLYENIFSLLCGPMTPISLDEVRALVRQVVGLQG